VIEGRKEATWGERLGLSMISSRHMAWNCSASSPRVIADMGVVHSRGMWDDGNGRSQAHIQGKKPIYCTRVISMRIVEVSPALGEIIRSNMGDYLYQAHRAINMAETILRPSYARVHAVTVQVGTTK
jgi:hypothetical protein